MAAPAPRPAASHRSRLQPSLCGGRRGDRRPASLPRPARACRQGADRRARHRAHRGDPRPQGRPRRRRGVAARIFALHQGGPRPDGAGRGAAARARRRDRRPADRGQARPGRFRRPRSQSPTPSWSRPRPGRSASPRASSSPARRPTSILGRLAKRLGVPAVRTATRQAMRVMGNHFVLGQTIEEALKRAALRQGPALPLFLRHAGRRRPHRRRRRPLLRSPTPTPSTPSAARPATAAAEPARHLGQALGAAPALRGAQASACWPSSSRASSSSPAQAKTLRPQLHHRRRGGRPARPVARGHRGACCADPALAGWDGFGLAVQAYQKRAARGDRLRSPPWPSATTAG